MAWGTHWQNRRMAWLAGAAVAALTAQGAHAQDGATEDSFADDDVIVVTGSLIPRPASEIGSAVTVLEADRIEATQTVIISDVLRSVPGLAVNRTGQQGGLTQVRIRGAEGNQTLVYIDGIEAANPVFGEFNFANLVSADIERIEVLRGPQSALYGSEALGGVISVFTKGPGEGFNSEFEAEGGSFGTFRLFGGMGYGSDIGGVRVSAQYYTTDGESVSPTGSEDDGFENITANLKGNVLLMDRFTVEGVVRYAESEAESDEQEFSFGTVVDSADSSETEDLLGKIDITGPLLGDWLMGRAFIAYADTEVVNLDGGAETSFSRGDRIDYGLHLTGQRSYGPYDLSLTAAVEHEEVEFENVNQQRDDSQTSLIGEYNLGVDDRLFASAAVRHDFNDVFDDATTYRFSAAFLMPAYGTRFHASFGEGITDPGFNERFGFDPDTFIGNPDLVPERSQGWDIGVTQSFFGGRALVDVTYFNADLEDEIQSTFQFIDGQFISSVDNIPGESEREGVEVYLMANLLGGLTFDAQYTYLDATGADELVEVRRPEHTAAANITYTGLEERLTVNLGVDYNGEQEDLFFGFADPDFTPRKTLDAYTLVRLSGSYKLTDYLQVFARGENIFDEDYTEVLGFSTPGAAFFAGVRATY